MKILIAGGGKIGSTLADQLSDEDHEITVIDQKSEVLDDIIEKYDVITMLGNAASLSVLEEAGVKEADLLIAVTDRDEVNMLACMTAHNANPNLHTIARIRDPEYRAQAFDMRELFGLSMSINPEQQAAVEIARLLKYPGFLRIETFARGRVEIVELKVDGKSPLNHTALKDMSKVIHTQVLVCVVERNGECIMPDGNFVVETGDLLYITAASDKLSTLLKNIGIIPHKVKRVILAGGGRISYYLIKELESTGMDCTVIDSNQKRCEYLAEEFPKSTIICGDATNQDFLDSEGIGDSDALVTLTGMDELNIVISLYGHTRNVSQVVTKLSHAENNKILDELELGSVISPKEMASNAIVRYVRAMINGIASAVTVHKIAGGKAEAIEFVVDEDTKHIGTPLKNIKTRSDVLIASIARHGHTEISSGNSHFEVGDVVVIVTNTKAQVHQLNDIFGD